MNRSAASSGPDLRLRRLEWTVIRRLDGLLQGDYRTFFQGLGLDCSDLRPYQFGDDVRTIDWNATARLREPHVRKFHEDRELNAWFLVDVSASLRFGSGDRAKLDVAADVVGTLAWLLSRRGNRVGACLFDGTLPRLVPAAHGRAAVLTVLGALAEPASDEITPETDLSVLLEAMAGVLRRRALVFLISDFHGPPVWQPALGTLALRHEVVAVRVSDPLESALPNVGSLWLEDAETGKQVLVDTGDRAFRHRFAAAAREHSEALARGFRTARVDPFVLGTHDDFVRSLLAFAQRRQYRTRIPGGKTR